MAAILLGNGFSIAYNPDMFSYDALMDAAEFPNRLRGVFNTVGTSDFEHVMRRLNQAYDLLEHYHGTNAARGRLLADIEIVRTSLIHALTEYHPASADQVDNDEMALCAAFLGRYEQIYTTNYDLLLYWVVTRHLTDDHFDGFGGNPLVWQRGDTAQNVYYLHGGLHLYREGLSTRKRRYGGGTPILAQLQDAMEEGEVPLFVSEGEWAQKLSAIRESPYLNYCYEALAANRQTLTLYGFGFHQNDRHIINAIARSRTRGLAVVLHSAADGVHRNRIRERARSLKDRIDQRNNSDIPLRFIESNTLQVWR